ncbi:MAG: lytic transglycosylase domain-containing protein [Gammaproteobacteria bacterium]|nr:MAG: lytic transglycosylase domain-containing protein [Gammaproteobacteria bacterium]
MSMRRTGGRAFRDTICVVGASLLLCGAARPDEDPALIDRIARSVASEAAQADHFDAEVWLMSSHPKLARYVADEAERIIILSSVFREAIRHEIDPDLVLAVIHVESAFNRFAISSAGAQGLMQVMPFWRAQIGRPKDNLTEIDTNVQYGTAILAHYLDVANRDLIDALARYNGSRGRLNYPERVVYSFRTRWQTQSPDQLPELRAGCLAYNLKACAPLGYR